jgi:hypothetical protein
VRLLGLKITKTINMATKKFGVSGISMNGWSMTTNMIPRYEFKSV